MTYLGGNPGSQDNPSDVKYFQTFFGYQWRPNAQMPIEAHEECGHLLKQVTMATGGQQGAHELVAYVRGTLDDWAMREYDDSELDLEALGRLYYPGPHLTMLTKISCDDLIRMLLAVEARLLSHYPDGIALPKLLQLIGQAIASIAKWDGKPRGKVYRDPFQSRWVRPPLQV